MWHASRLFSLIWLLCGVLWVEQTYGDELQVGDAAPEFQCVDDRGQAWNSKDIVGKKMIVVFFYPSDFSFCGTRQVLRYRDRLSEFHDLGAEVVGISGDAVEAHRQFQAAHKLNFPLLSDTKGDVARKFGVPLRDGGKAMLAVPGNAMNAIPREVTAARWSFVIDKQGRLIYRNTEVSPVKDCQEILEFLRKRAGE